MQWFKRTQCVALEQDAQVFQSPVDEISEAIAAIALLAQISDDRNNQQQRIYALDSCWRS